jgi:predicted nucleic acid-binding protein
MTFIAAAPPIVVDASVAVGSVTDEQPAIDALRTWSRDSVALLAPPMLWLEIANALVRGQRLSPVDVSGILRTLRMSGIEIADRGADGLDAALVLAGRHRLTVYDATYLWLAIDVDGELATFDRALARAAAAEGVPLALGPAAG